MCVACLCVCVCVFVGVCECLCVWESDMLSGTHTCEQITSMHLIKS